jgi:hypothetical protein
MEYDIEEILYNFEDDYNPGPRPMNQGPRNMNQGGSIGKPGGLVEDGVTKYGVTETASGSYKAEAIRRGKRFSETFKTKSEAEAALEKFKKDNPTYVEENTLSPKQKKQYIQDPKKIKALNAYAQAEYGVNYTDLFGKKDRAKQQSIYQKAFNNNFKYVATNTRTPFDSKEKAKLTNFAKKNNIKLNYDDYPKYGVKKILENGKINPNYTAVYNFANKDNFTIKPVDSSQIINATKQEFIKNNFELPEGKEWNFKSKNNPNGYKYGVAGTKGSGTTNLAKRIENRMSNKKLAYTVAADTSTPEGWMMNAMNRLYEREIENKVKPENLTYKPIKKNGIIIGFTDTTAAGGNKTYYGLKKNRPEDATPWAGHKDFDRINKFLDIAKGAQVNDPSKLLQKILDDKGITKLMGSNVGDSVLTLNDILSHERYYTKLSDVAPSELIKRQVVLHHENRIGSRDLAKAAATKDIQLLTGAVNNEVRKLETIASKRKLNADELTKLKNLGVRIQDFDGKVVGGGFTDPIKQFAAIEKKALEYAKGDQFNVKTVASYLERLGCGKAAGGRILFAEGVPSLTKCAQKGVTKLENGLKSGFKNADDAVLARGILKSGKFLKDAVSLRGLLGPAALAFTVAAEAGIVGYDMLSSGKSFREAVGDSVFNYMLGDKTKINPEEEFIKRLKNIPGSPSQGFRGFTDDDINKMLVFKSKLKDMETGFSNYSDLINVDEKIKENTLNQNINPQFFSDNAFQLEAEKDRIQADIRDYNKVGTPRNVTDYMYSDKATKGSDALARGTLLAKENQLLGVNPTSKRGIENLEKNLIDTRFNLGQINNPTKYDEFGEYFISRPKQEQSRIMSYGYREGGIASLNVNKK